MTTDQSVALANLLLYGCFVCILSAGLLAFLFTWLLKVFRG